MGKPSFALSLFPSLCKENFSEEGFSIYVAITVKTKSPLVITRALMGTPNKVHHNPCNHQDTDHNG